jgi:hypothetical protein
VDKAFEALHYLLTIKQHQRRGKVNANAQAQPRASSE